MIRRIISARPTIGWGKNACISHKIEARDLYNLVLKDIQELAKTALKHADVFYQRLSSRMERRYMADASEMQKERERLESRNREIDEMFLSLYTDKSKRYAFRTAICEADSHHGARAGRKSAPFTGTVAKASAVR